MERSNPSFRPFRCCLSKGSPPAISLAPFPMFETDSQTDWKGQTQGPVAQPLTTFPRLHNLKASCFGQWEVGVVHVALSLGGSLWVISYNPNLGQTNPLSRDSKC